MIRLVIGITLILASLWGGAFALDFFKDTVYEFSAYMTAVVVFSAGLVYTLPPYEE